MKSHWLLDTQWGCGGIVSVNGVIVETAPIFHRFKGARIEDLKTMYKLQPVFSPEIENQKQTAENLGPRSHQDARTGRS